MSNSNILKAILFALLAVFIPVVFNFQPIASPIVQHVQEINTAESKQGDLEQLFIWMPESLAITEKLGIEALKSEQYEKGYQLLEQVDKHSSLTTEGLFLLGDAYIQMGKKNDGMAVWRKITPENQESRLYLNRIVSRYIEEWMIPEAAIIYEKWYSASGDKLDGLNAAGLMIHDSPSKARLIFDRIHDDSFQEIFPQVQIIQKNTDEQTKQDSAWLYLAEWFRRKKAYPAAESAVLAILRENPDNGSALSEYGIIRLITDRDGSAEIRRAVSNEPNSVAVNMKIAEFWMIQNRPDAALVYLQQADLIEPDNHQILRSLGEVQLVLELTNEGLASFTASAELTPGNSDPWLRIAKYCLDHHDQIETIGINAARKAILADEKNPVGYDVLGQMYLVLGDGINAEKMLRNALQIEPGNSDAAIHLSLFLQEQARTDEAKIILTEAMEKTTDMDQKKIMQDQLSSLK